MKRTTGWFGAGLVLCALVLIPIGMAGASPTRTSNQAARHRDPVGFGTPTCSAVGKLSFHPALKTGGTATSEEVSITGKLTACSPALPTPLAGKLDGKGIIHGAGANNCALYFPTGIMTFTSAGFFVETKWKPAAIHITEVDFPTLTITNPGGAAGPEIFTAGPTPIVAGTSYAPAETLTLSTFKSQGTITGLGAGNCGGAGGLKTAAFVPPGSTGTF